MTTRDKRRRLALIKLLAESNRFEEGSASRAPDQTDFAEVEARGTRAGAEWAARARGLLGGDKHRVPKSNRPGM